jgi:hypothetical protein
MKDTWINQFIFSFVLMGVGVVLLSEKTIAQETVFMNLGILFLLGGIGLLAVSILGKIR